MKKTTMTCYFQRIYNRYPLTDPATRLWYFWGLKDLGAVGASGELEAFKVSSRSRAERFRALSPQL